MITHLSLFLAILVSASSASSGWKQLALPVEASSKISIMLVLNIENASQLDELVAKVSDPRSPSYTNYLTFNELIQKFAPKEEKIAEIFMWLRGFGVKIEQISMTPTRDFIELVVPVETAEKLFSVKFSLFRHAKLGTLVRSTGKPVIPPSIQKHIAIISGVNNFPSGISIHSEKPRQSKNKQSEVNPQFIWNAFNTGGIKGTAKGNAQAVAQFLQQYFDPADLASFQQTFNLPNQPIAKVMGPNDPTNPGDEASLDVEYITGTAPGIPTWFVSTSGLHQGQERFLVWAQTLNNLAAIPLVHSVSYGDYENSIDPNYAQRLEVEFKKLALRGITVLFSSGDNGVGCNNNCVNVPNWPAESPMVTAVGGFDGGFNGDSISSGGFSNFFPTPLWQKQAVQGYLSNSNNNLPPSNQYNSSGRGVPDISAFSENVIIISGGNQEPVGGTSCASPTFAGVLSLINDALLNKGKKPIGYINPAIYQIAASKPSAFIDITSGNNANGCCNGFNCATGWDPLSGLGGPNFPVLRDAFIALQSK